MANIIVTFIAKSRYEASSVMHTAFEQSKIQYNLDPKWVTVDECLDIDKSTLLKTDVFILEDFSGQAFDHLVDSKALIIGTRCLLKCLSQAKELPPWTHPIYSLAMEGMQVTSSGFKINERDKIQKYVEWMGGVYDKLLHKRITHLIANNVTSVKYSKAAGDIPVMRMEWIEAIWEASNRETMTGDCSDFQKESLQTYRLQPFHGLHITSASLTKVEREKVKNSVEANGGTYMGNYKSDITDLVVTTQAGITSAKYKAARAAQKECVTPEWIYQSEISGYAVSMDNYRAGANCSTPTKSDAAETLEKNFSMMSALNETTNRSALNSVNESFNVTEMTSLTTFTKPIDIDNTVILMQKSSVKDLFDMKEVKNAGLFLDGCGIYLSGYSIEDRDFLNRILNYGGATRYDEPCDRVSHVIVAKPGGLEEQLFKEKDLTPFFVSLDWIAHSVKLKKLALEDDYITKDAKNSAKPNRKPMFPENGIHQEEMLSPRTERLAELEQSKVLQMYKNVSTPATTAECSTMQTSTEETIKAYLYGVQFQLRDLNGEIHQELENLIKEAGGIIVESPNKSTDYVIAPELCSREITPSGKAQLVSPLFIRSCVEKQEHVPVEYYHCPIMNSVKKPLSGLVFTASTYCGLERYFIGELSKELGATFMDTMRKNNPTKKIIGTTHLICKQANGKKYEACLHWGLPGVTSNWLLECARTQTRVSEENYLVGDTKCPVKSSSIPTENVSLAGNDSIIKNPVLKPMSTSRKRTSSDELENNINVPMNVSMQTPAKVAKNAVMSPLHTPSPFYEVSREVNGGKSTPLPVQTPVRNKFLANAAMSLETPSPLHKVLGELRGENRTPESPGLPPLPDWMKTPDSPYGAFLWGPNPTPETRKRWKRFCDGLPSPDTPAPPKPPSPTWSELKRELFAKILKPSEESPEHKGKRLEFEKEPSEAENAIPQNSTEHSEPSTSKSPTSLLGMNTQVQKLNALLTSGGLGGNVSNNRMLTPTSRKPSLLHNIDTINLDGIVKESQAESVGWRDPSELESARESILSRASESDLQELQPFRKRPPRFLLSGVKESGSLLENILALGGEICSQDKIYDASCSHILADNIGRSEKILAGLAGGKWILSTAYITHCMGEGRFVEEDQYEFGNPDFFTASESPDTEAEACYRMRCRFNNKPVENTSEGAFTGWKVLVQIARKESFERVIQAGFGEVVHCKKIEMLQEGSVTHCFCEPRKKTLSIDDTRHLNRIGVQVLPIQYLNLYLTSHPLPDPREYLITV